VDPKDLATCQCIISHPSKPKFMAIKHATGFLPPVLKLPLDYNPNKNVRHLLDVIGQKYGLHTTGLRQLVYLRDYHCVELELHGKGDRPLEAVWVGLEDYIRIRGTDQFGSDPLAKWLHEKNSGVVPATRPAWEKTGWFKGASAWIHHQLDHLNIQATGAISQFNAFRRRSQVLKVPTSAGKLFFKATYIRKPLEVPLTLALARHWPLNTPQLLAFDEKRNWMLMRDAKEAEKHSSADADYTAAASAMARIQVESLENLAEWTELGCAPTGLDQLRAFLAQPDWLGQVSKFDSIGQDISDEERARLVEIGPGLVDLCDRLAEYGIPETLVHPDFWWGNFVSEKDSIRIIDWCNSTISHPFFCFRRLLQLAPDREEVEPGSDPVVAAYLEPFRVLDSQSRLLEALALARELEPAWRLLCWSDEFDYVEPDRVTSIVAQRFNYGLVRQLLNAHRQT
jgi:hypothetical protein